MTAPAAPTPRAIWTSAALDALADLLDWLEEVGGDPDARRAEIVAAADAAARDPDIMQPRWGSPPHVVRWWQAGAKALVVYWHDQPPGATYPGHVYVLHVAHADQEERLPRGSLRRAYAQLGVKLPQRP